MNRPGVGTGVVAVVMGAGLAFAPVAAARYSDPGAVTYAVLSRGAVSNIVGAQLGAQWEFSEPYQAYSVNIPECNNWTEIGLDEVYQDPDLASFNAATTQDSDSDMTHFVRQAVGVFATADAADRAFHRVVDRTHGCAGQTAVLTLDDGQHETWTFTAGTTGADDQSWSKQQVGTDRRCFVQTRRRENVLLQAKVCQPGNGSLAVNVLADTMQNALGQ